MSTLDRELFRRIGLAFLVALIALLFFVLAVQWRRLSRSLTGVAVRLEDVLELSLLLSPSVLVLALPFSVLGGQLVGLGTLAAEGALLGMGGLGVSGRRLARMPVLLGASVALLGVFLAHGLAPVALARLESRLATMILDGMAESIRSQRVSSLSGTTLFRGISTQTDLLVYRSEGDGSTWVLTSRRSEISTAAGALSLSMSDGSVRAFGIDSDFQVFFETGRLPLDLNARALSTRTAWIGEIQRTSSLGLLRDGLGSVSPEARRKLRDFLRRTTLPAAAWVLSYLAFALVWRLGPDRLILAAAGGLGALILHYGVSRAVDTAINSTQWPVWLLVPLPDLAVVVAAVAVGGIRELTRNPQAAWSSRSPKT